MSLTGFAERAGVESDAQDVLEYKFDDDYVIGVKLRAHAWISASDPVDLTEAR